MISTDNKLYGLVLAGGKSTRMGSDKSVINYHGEPHREYLYHLLQQVCDEVFLSVRPEQKDGLSADFNFIEDKDLYRGPFNGLFSAHLEFQNAAWLVLACDLPLVNKEAVQQLQTGRNPKALATAFASRQSQLPEPLFAIWEPHAFAEAKEFLETGSSTCPRKFLINANTHLLFPEDEEVLLNANHPQDYEKVKEKLQAI